MVKKLSSLFFRFYRFHGQIIVWILKLPSKQQNCQTKCKLPCKSPGSSTALLLIDFLWQTVCSQTWNMLSVFIKNCKSKTLISWRCFNSLSFIRCCSYSSHWGAKTNILDINCLSVNVTSIHMNYDISFSLWVCLWKKKCKSKTLFSWLCFSSLSFSAAVIPHLPCQCDFNSRVIFILYKSYPHLHSHTH